MPICKLCKKEFPNRILVDGKIKIVNTRKYCIECSPIGLHNTKKIDGELRIDQQLNCKCKCGETNPDKFYGRKRTVCSKCHNEYTIQKGKELKVKAVEYKGGKCEICGYNKCNASLDFHHTDPTNKDINFKNKNGWKWERLKDELDKCILICRNCHSELHYG